MWTQIKDFFTGHAVAQAQGKLVLIIDDGEVERLSMEKTLARKGYTVLTAANAQDGIKLAREKKPDAIFLDYAMPGMNGKEACAILKNNARTKDIPIVFLSGSVTPGKVIECYDVGAEYYLSKPISAATLLEHTRLLIEDASFSKGQPPQPQQ